MAENLRYAGLWPRFLALFTDLLLFCLVFFPVTRLIKGAWLLTANDHRWNEGLFITDPLCLTFLFIMFIYFVFLEGLYGVTFGKWVLGLRVEGEDGDKPGLYKGLVRNLLRIVDGLPALNIIGIILIVGSEQRARFGDRIAQTRVVHVKQDQSV